MICDSTGFKKPISDWLKCSKAVIQHFSENDAISGFSVSPATAEALAR